MSAALADHTGAFPRPCFWTPDFAGLSLLKPLRGRALQVSGPLTVNVADASPLSLSASSWLSPTIGANNILAGSWTTPQPNQAVLFENIRFALAAGDASGKLQITYFQLQTGDAASVVPSASSVILPYTMPVNGPTAVWNCWCLNPVPLLVPRPLPSTTGPIAFIGLLNTDGAGAHTYTRRLAYTYRLIDNCDFTAGPALPGAGL